MAGKPVDVSKTAIQAGAMAVLALVVVGFGLHAYAGPVTCGRQSMSAGDLCMVEGDGDDRRETLVSAASLPTAAIPAPGFDWESVQPGYTIPLSNPTDALRTASNVRSFSEQASSNRRNGAVMMITGTLLLVVSVCIVLWQSSRRRREL